MVVHKPDISCPGLGWGTHSSLMAGWSGIMHPVDKIIRVILIFMAGFSILVARLMAGISQHSRGGGYVLSLSSVFIINTIPGAGGAGDRAFLGFWQRLLFQPSG